MYSFYTESQNVFLAQAIAGENVLTRGRRSSDVAVFTSVSRKYLPKAIIMARSVKKFHPDWDIHILINDDVPNYFSPFLSVFHTMMPVGALRKSVSEAWLFGMDAEEMCCASRPIYMSHLLDAGYKKVIFFDPDILIFQDLNFLVDILDRNDVVITPHCETASTRDSEILMNEISVLAHGVFNLGFLAVNSSRNARKVVDYWKYRLSRYSHKDHAKGLWTDQKWFNLVPIYFDGVFILKHKGCNTSSWNISSRKITKRGDRYFAENDPLVFFHFSGYDKGVPIRMYQMYGRYDSVMEDLFQEYKELNQNSELEIPDWQRRWSFAAFDNGELVPFAVRKYYRHAIDFKMIYPQPFRLNGFPSFYEHAKIIGMDTLIGEFDPPGRLRRYF